MEWNLTEPVFYQMVSLMNAVRLDRTKQWPMQNEPRSYPEQHTATTNRTGPAHKRRTDETGTVHRERTDTMDGCAHR
jgi:hypothetical protein